MDPKPQANRRTRLLLWRLFNRTPLALPIDTQAEQEAAKAVKMDWPTYERLKAQHPELWAKAEAKRAKAFRSFELIRLFRPFHSLIGSRWERDSIGIWMFHRSRPRRTPPQSLIELPE